jgi:hypothetical protein
MKEERRKGGREEKQGNWWGDRRVIIIFQNMHISKYQGTQTYLSGRVCLVCQDPGSGSTPSTNTFWQSSCILDCMQFLFVGFTRR